MTKDEDAIVKSNAINRKNLIQLIVIAILLSFGVNLLASQFLVLPIANPIVTTLFGIGLCFLSLAYIFVSLFGRRTKSHTYEAFIINGPAEDNITPVPGYELSEEVYGYIRGAFAENSALKTLWQKQPHKTHQLLIKAIEYFLLSSLSFHLSEYFNNTTFKKEKLATYERKDIPSVLLSNTFLELFSRPMSERPDFVNFGSSDDDQTVFAIGPSGVMYDKFELTLPKGSKVRRPQNNRIEIETKKLKILMAVHFDGSHTILPRNFEQYYLHLLHDMEHTDKGLRSLYDIYVVYINIQITIKSRAMLSSSGWEYYRWVDSFLERIEKEVSQEAFFNRINWENVVTLLECIKNKPSTNVIPEDHSKLPLNSKESMSNEEIKSP